MESRISPFTWLVVALSLIAFLLGLEPLVRVLLRRSLISSLPQSGLVSLNWSLL